MKSVVIYYSKYGSTRTYAEWLAEATGAELVPQAEAKKLEFAGYDAVAFGCPYYAGQLKLAGFVKACAPRLAGKRVAFFAVGAAEPDSPDARKGYDNALPEEVRAGMRFFFLRGRIELARLNAIERTVMKLMKARDVDHTDRAAIAPLAGFLLGSAAGG
ncbi:MAG: flavodoxin domain-containing protein [bacterium]